VISYGVRALNGEQAAVLRGWFLPDRPGPLVGLHVLQTGYGTCSADRWPHPRALLAEVAGNYALVGEPEVLGPDDLIEAQLVGFVDAPEPFEPLLRAALSTLAVWPRVIMELDPCATAAGGSPVLAGVYRLGPTDAAAIGALSPEVGWVAKTWGGASGLAAGGYAWGAFADGRLVSLACSFFVGERFEDVGVATEPAYRGRGLALACASGLCGDIRDRGRRPSWTTSPENRASLRVAQKLGFVQQRNDRLLVVGRGVH
jgi:GNAT superfamily N-acetyltransferase